MALLPLIQPIIGATSIVSFTDMGVIISSPMGYLRINAIYDALIGLAFKGTDFLTALKRFPITAFTRVEDSIVCKHGRSTFTLGAVHCTPIELPITSNLTLSSDFYIGVDTCKIAGNKSPYSGVYVDDKTIITTDGKSVITYQLDEGMDTFWLSDSSCKLFLNYKCDRYYLDPTYFVGIHTDYTLYLRRLRHEVYPKNRLLTFFDCGAINVAPLPANTAVSIKEVSSMGMEDGNCKIFLSGTNDTLIISGGKRTGSYTLELPWDNGYDFKFVGLYRHLASLQDGDLISVSSDKLVYTRKNITAMILGMREGG